MRCEWRARRFRWDLQDPNAITPEADFCGGDAADGVFSDDRCGACADCEGKRSDFSANGFIAGCEFSCTWCTDAKPIRRGESAGRVLGHCDGSRNERVNIYGARDCEYSFGHGEQRDGRAGRVERSAAWRSAGAGAGYAARDWTADRAEAWLRNEIVAGPAHHGIWASRVQACAILARKY